MHYDAMAVNPSPSTMRVATWNPWTGSEMVEVPATRFDVVTTNGEPLPPMSNGDSFSITQTFDYE